MYIYIDSSFLVSLQYGSRIGNNLCNENTHAYWQYTDDIGFDMSKSSYM